MPETGQNMNRSRIGIHAFLMFIVLISFTRASQLLAQELEPRIYNNIPVGLNFLLAGYAYTAGGIQFDPSLPLENANMRTHGALMAYARSVKLGGVSGKVDMVLPYAWLSGSADYQGQPVTREVSGLGDPRIRMSVNFLGSPALSLAEYKDYKQNLIVGASLQVYLPLGQYNPEKLVNIGTNRYTFKPEIGVSKAFGRLLLELATGVLLITDNKDFYGGTVRSQDPIGSIQAHAIYTFQKGVWVAFDGTYYWGGQSTVDGAYVNDLLKNSRMGMVLALPLNLHHSLKFYASTGVSTRTGTDFDIIGMAWQYRWARAKSN